MKKFMKIACFLLCFVLLAAEIAPTIAQAGVTPAVREVVLSAAEVDNQSCLSVFDDYEFEIDNEEGKANLIGYKEIPLTDLYDLDLIADTDVEAAAQTRFSCTYDYENGMVVLSALLESDVETVVLDEIYGVVFMNEEGAFDVVFSVEDDVMLLSEMKEAGMIDECGLFSKIGSKLKKVLKTTAGKVGTIATVAACAAVGVVCAVVPGGQLVTAVCIGVAVGAVGGAVTAAAATYQADGAIDWEAVGICAGVGAVVGGAVSAASYGVTTAVKTATSSTADLAAKRAAAIKQNNIPTTKFQTSQLQHEFKHAKDLGIQGKWNKATGEQFKNAIQSNIDSATNIYRSTYRGQSIYVYYNQATNVGVYVDMAGNYISSWALTAAQYAFHAAQVILL